MAQPLFITFEGGEGAGKSTQITLLSQALIAAGQPHILTREPGGSDSAEAIRALVVEGDVERWDPLSETLLFMAARQHHWQHTIQPALHNEKWVLCDRYLDSTRVYQGLGKKLGDSAIMQLHRQCFGQRMPDITFICDIEPEEGIARTRIRNSGEARFESMDIAFHQHIRQGFLDIAATEPERCHVIDAAASVEAIHATICAILRISPVEQAA